MTKDWFPFFSMLFWCATKLAGLGLAVSGFMTLLGSLLTASEFWRLVLMSLVPLAAGYFLLVSEFAYDLATSEQRRRQAVAK